MKCVKCNNELDQGARFCGACGTQQPGAVIPQASVRTNQKTLFQGSGAAAVPVIKPPISATLPAAGPPSSMVPDPKMDKKGPVSQAAFAATMAPSPAEMKALLPSQPKAVIAPERPKQNTPPVSMLAPPAVDVDLTGKLLNNRYQVEAKIGEGGFGAVYRAMQVGMNRKVALKVLHARMAKDQQVVGRFRREAQASSLLRAPHTVQVYDFDQSPDGIMYLAMEMLTGRSLHAILQEDGPLEPLRLARVLDGIADSLGEAHAQGIVHRDIKPENIFLEPRPTKDFAKVLDFGIAKIVGGEGGMASGPALTAAGQTLGTLEYMSPEQLMGAQLDGRSDLYALGILAYELVTGHLPFPVKTPGEMITGHLKTVPPPPSQVAPTRGIPPLFDHVIGKLLAKKREDRYRDTAELRVDLERVIRGEGGAPAPAPVVVKASQPQRHAPSTDKVTTMPPPAAPKLTTKAIVIVAGLVVLVAAIVATVLLIVLR
jgi:eukaryotic-like serine/threonine-protein kinase